MVKFIKNSQISWGQDIQYIFLGALCFHKCMCCSKKVIYWFVIFGLGILTKNPWIFLVDCVRTLFRVARSPFLPKVCPEGLFLLHYVADCNLTQLRCDGPHLMSVDQSQYSLLDDAGVLHSSKSLWELSSTVMLASLPEQGFGCMKIYIPKRVSLKHLPFFRVATCRSHFPPKSLFRRALSPSFLCCLQFNAAKIRWSWSKVSGS